jgi:hypothetical protein
VRAVIVLLAGACESAPVSPRPPPPPPIPPTPPTIVDAAERLDLTPVDRTPAPTIPVTLASATPWMMRQLYVGMVPYPQRAETFTLRRDDGRAVLEVATQKAISSKLVNIDGWKPPTVRTYHGTAIEAAGTVTLDLADGSDTLHLVCKPAKQKVAPSDAVRKPGPRRGEACGDQGRWVPGTTSSVDVLRCDADDKHAGKYGNSPHLAFAPAPGIEWTYVNDDCSMQGGGWRLVPADGSIARFRSN